MSLVLAHRPEGLPVAKACAALGLSRSSFYALSGSPPRERPLDARVEAACLRFESYGHRRIAAWLGREGEPAGAKAVRASMRRLGLLARPKPRARRTTFPVPTDAANLLREGPPEGPRRVLAADATWIPLGGGRGLYLAAVLDLFTRQALGCALGTRLDSRLALDALAEALSKGLPEPGWIHHSDRGSTYASEAYRRCVAAAGGRSSFTKPGSPQENGAVESFFKTLKHEETRRNEYESPEEAVEALKRYLRFYNAERLHSSLAYRSPDEFHERLQSRRPP